MAQPRIESESELVEEINSKPVIRRSGNQAPALCAVYDITYDGQDDEGMYFVIICDIYCGSGGFRDTLLLGDVLPEFSDVAKGLEGLFKNFPFLKIASIVETDNPSGDPQSFGGIAVEVLEPWTDYNKFYREG